MSDLTLQQAHEIADRHLHAGQLAEAAAMFQHIVAQIPSDTSAASKLALILFQTGRMEEALRLMRGCVQLRPNDAGYRSNLGVLLSTLGRFEEAVPVYQSAMQLNPNMAEVHSNLGNALRETGQYAESVARFRTALRLRPDYADALWNLGFVLLAQGDFAAGWPAYEARLRMPSPAVRQFSRPMWDGSPLNGRTILIHAEQGMGDTFNFIRYAPRVAAMGGRVIVQVQQAVYRLMRSQLLDVDSWLANEDPLPPFDVHCPLLSLPGLLGTTMRTIPPQSPPITADPQLAATWKQLLAGNSAKLKVGLVWAGNPYPMHNRKRSATLEALLPLADMKDVSFYSLQKGLGPPNPATVYAMRLIDFTPALNDFADTAAMIDALDLVISIDTGVAHLAAAMGKPTWTLLPVVPDWRYFLERSDSPWYPSMRLFRQPTAGDWATPIARIVAELRRLVG